MRGAVIANELAAFVDKLADKQRVVVTDRYPPNAHGGAELSLHIMLRSLRRRSKVVVLAFNENIVGIRHYELDGVDVVEAPAPAAWPFHNHAAKTVEHVNSLSRAKRMIIKLLWLARYLLGGAPSGLVRRAFRLWNFFFNRFDYPGMIDDEEHGASLRGRVFERLSAMVQPALVHADNYRSIIAISKSVKRRDPTVLVGLVRDNRFSCAERNQSMNIDGFICQPSCGFECQERYDWRSDVRRGLMRDNVAIRQTALRRLDRVIVTSGYLEKQIGQIVNPAIVRKLVNPSDLVSLVDKATLGVAEEPGFNILVVGMLNENKGQIGLVERLGEIAAAVPDARLWFAGRGERIAKRIREIAAKQNCEDRVKLLGYLGRDDLYRVMRKVQVVALPTVWPEPFGRVPLEAGLSRRPVVAYAVGGLVETIEDDANGLLIEPKDGKSFSEALVELARNPHKCRAMGAEGRRRAYEVYNPEALVHQLEATWRDAERIHKRRSRAL